MNEIEAQFEMEWEILRDQLRDELVREHFGVGGVTVAATEMCRALLDDAKPYMLRLALGEPAGRIVLELCKRQAYSQLSGDDALRLVRDAKPKDVH